MKRVVVLLMALMLTSSSLAESILVTYFSHAGENYNVGVIEEGNTAKLAKVIAEQTGAELFNQETVQKLFIHYACLNPPLRRCRRSTCPGTPPSSALH